MYSSTWGSQDFHVTSEIVQQVLPYFTAVSTVLLPAFMTHVRPMILSRGVARILEKRGPKCKVISRKECKKFASGSHAHPLNHVGLDLPDRGARSLELYGQSFY